MGLGKAIALMTPGLYGRRVDPRGWSRERGLGRPDFAKARSGSSNMAKCAAVGDLIANHGNAAERVRRNLEDEASTFLGWWGAEGPTTTYSQAHLWCDLAIIKLGSERKDLADLLLPARERLERALVLATIHRSPRGRIVWPGVRCKEGGDDNAEGVGQVVNMLLDLPSNWKGWGATTQRWAHNYAAQLLRDLLASGVSRDLFAHLAVRDACRKWIAARVVDPVLAAVLDSICLRTGVIACQHFRDGSFVSWFEGDGPDGYDNPMPAVAAYADGREIWASPRSPGHGEEFKPGALCHQRQTNGGVECSLLNGWSLVVPWPTGAACHRFEVTP